jgi:hypothetical protein
LQKIRRGKMKKKILGSLLVICILFSYGLAGAVTVAQEDQSRFSASAVPGAYGLWFPAVPSLPALPPQGYGWESYIILANWHNFTINISAIATAFSTDPGNQPTTKSFRLGPFQKVLVTLASWGFSDTIADIWLTADGPIFGATVLLIDLTTGKVLTAIPHIETSI